MRVARRNGKEWEDRPILSLDAGFVRGGTLRTMEADDFLGLLSTARSVRRYSAEPIPEADLAKILYAASRAPSGTNRQPFRFIVLREGPRALRARRLLGESFRRGWTRKTEEEGWNQGSAADPNSPKSRVNRAVQHYVDHFEQIPAVVIACYVRYRALTHSEGASVFPACQNLFLMARALGYGACFSGWHHAVADELREILEIPDNVELSLTITIGRPLGRHGPLRRRPIRDTVFDDGWEQGAEWIEDPDGARLSRTR